MMAFSFRTPSDLTPNPISNLIDSLSEEKWIDLTESNPTHCGFSYPPTLLKDLSDHQNLSYSPHSAGIPSAREAVAAYLNARGLTTNADRILLTASTSEAYSYLFKLLGEPGDSFLVPIPGYPLLDHLARLESVRPIPYSFKYEDGWPLDIKAFQMTIKEKHKALVSVNPQNPTGVPLSDQDLVCVLKACAEGQMAFISDEVFWDFLIPVRPYRRFNHPDVLSFRLGGISKSLGLPQLKLAWIVIDGPEKLVLEAKERLEFIADTYLSVQTPVQTALPGLFQSAESFQSQVRTRISQNRKWLESNLSVFQERVRLWPLEGGWYNLVEIKDSPLTDEEWTLNLLEKEKVLIHPGSFYEFQEGCFGVISLLPKPKDFEEGVTRIAQNLTTIL